MSGFFRKLFGGGPSGAAPAAKPEEHKGFLIFPEPMREGSRWRVAARIEKQVDGEAKVHRLIRADVLDSEQAAREQSVAKSRQMIDEQGERIFDR